MAVLLTFLTWPRIRCFLASLGASTALILSAQAQDFGERSHKPQFPAETHPRVSEKDYKAALQKIPEPTQKYDPWGVAHPAEQQSAKAPPQKSVKKTN